MSPAASDELPQFKADWIEQALEAKALIFGDFTLKSGRFVPPPPPELRLVTIEAASKATVTS